MVCLARGVVVVVVVVVVMVVEGAACHGASAAVFFFPCSPCLFVFPPRFSKNRCTYPTVFKSRTYLFLPSTYLTGVHGAALFRRWSGPVQRGYSNRGCNPDPYMFRLIQHPGSIRSSLGWRGKT